MEAKRQPPATVGERGIRKIIFLALFSCCVVAVWTSARLSSALAPCSANDNLPQTSADSLSKKRDKDDEQDKKPPTLPSFPLLLDKVYLTDIVWIPYQSAVAFIAMNRKSFVHVSNLAKNLEPEKQLVELDGVPRKEFRSPMALQEGLKFTSNKDDTVMMKNNTHVCHEILAKSGDTNLDGALLIIHCYYNYSLALDKLEQVSVSYEDRQVAHFDIAPTNSPFVSLNAAASSMRFFRHHPQRKSNFSVSVLIKGVYQYSKFAADIMEYWYRQGISHVYLGVFPMDGPVHARYEQGLKKYTTMGFVSMGGMDKDTPTYEHMTLDGWKMSYIQSALYHAKYYDDMMIVVDMDEIMTSMFPTERSVVDLLGEVFANPNPPHCYYQLSPTSATSPLLPNRRRQNMPSLADHSPYRCLVGGCVAYGKSVAVVSNSDWVGFHLHGGCREGTMQRKAFFNSSEGMLLHFPDFWGNRCQPKNPESTTSIEMNQADSCNMTNEFKLFMESGVNFQRLQEQKEG